MEDANTHCKICNLIMLRVYQSILYSSSLEHQSVSPRSKEPYASHLHHTHKSIPHLIRLANLFGRMMPTSLDRLSNGATLTKATLGHAMHTSAICLLTSLMKRKPSIRCQYRLSQAIQSSSAAYQLRVKRQQRRPDMHLRQACTAPAHVENFYRRIRPKLPKSSDFHSVKWRARRDRRRSCVSRAVGRRSCALAEAEESRVLALVSSVCLEMKLDSCWTSARFAFLHGD
jgi:hypothetical protein